MTGLVVMLAMAQVSGLEPVLSRLGEDARQRERTAPCAYRETTTVEELGADGGVLGAEVRRYEVELAGTEVTRRDRVETVKSGAPLPDLLVEPKRSKGSKVARSPLHPESQAEYRFTLKDAQTVLIEPLKPKAGRVQGEARLDAKGQLAELRVRPSKVPLLLESLAMRFAFADTGCGRQAVEIDVDGKGVAVFIETKFRSRTRLEGHAPVKRR